MFEKWFYSSRQGKVIRFNCEEDNITTESKNIVEPKENWIWVDGYKGFNKEYINGELKLCGRDHFVYNPIGEVTCLPEDKDKVMDICHWGLHFCDKLKDVFKYYDVCAEKFFSYVWSGNELNQVDYLYIYNTTFAKVKAEVNEKDYLSWKESKKNKFVARKIIIEEIIPYEEVYDVFMSCHDKITIDGETIPSKEDYVAIKNSLDNCGLNTLVIYNKIFDSLRKERIKKQVENLVSHGYSETFANIIIDKYSYDDAIMYAEEGISKDMRVYLLMKGNNF